MPRVYIPSLLQRLTGGSSCVKVAGSTVREVIDNLDRAFPGTKDRLVKGDQLRANISVAIEGEITPFGLRERVDDDSEIHFVAAIKGGA